MCGKEGHLLCVYSVDPYSAVDCGDPGTPTNGQRTLSNTTYNSVVTYTCTTHYVLHGSKSRTCQSNGKWSGIVPQCKGMLVKVKLQRSAVRLWMYCHLLQHHARISVQTYRVMCCCFSCTTFVLNMLCLTEHLKMTQKGWTADSLRIWLHPVVFYSYT